VNNPVFNAPIPGMGMTTELGNRPWERPSQYATVDEALDFYIPRLADDEMSEQLVELMETGIPLTTIANGIQMNGVMEGKHSADVGILILPVLIEMMRFIGDSAGAKYDTGLEEKKKLRGSMVSRAVKELREEMNQEDTPEEVTTEPEQEELPMDMPSGLMARRS
jgi:hypothetical protein